MKKKRKPFQKIYIKRCINNELFSKFDIKTQFFFKLLEITSWDNELTIGKELKQGKTLSEDVTRQTVWEYLHMLTEKRWIVKIETNRYMFNPHYINSIDEARLVDLYKKWDKYMIEAKGREEENDAKKQIKL